MSQFLSQFQAWKYMIMTVVYSESATLDLAVPVDLAVNGGAATYTHGSVTHIFEPTRLRRISSAVYCLNKKKRR